MRVETSPVDVVSTTTEEALAEKTAPPGNRTFEERWAAWQDRGAAHDRAVRRKVAIGAPILAVAAADTAQESRNTSLA